MEQSIDVKKIPLNDLHIQLGAKMAPFAGFQMPVRYSGDLDEHLTVREGVGVFDVSHMGEFLIEGEKALDLIQKLCTNDASVLRPGKIQYSCFTNRSGGIIDDLLIYCLEKDRYMLVVNAGNIEKDWQWLCDNNTEGAILTDISDDTALFAVQGPKAVAVVQKLTSTDLTGIAYYSFTKGEVAGLQDVLISATGYTGAGGFELYVDKRYALELWKELFKAGERDGIKPIGLGARDTLRLEMGFCLYGNDIDDDTSPLEAGLGWITKFSKEFTASQKLQEQKLQGVEKKLIGFELEERGVPRSHYDIVDAQGKKIGYVTSGTLSPSLNKGIGLGYIATAYANPGEKIYISVRNKSLSAKIVKLPFFKR